MTDVEILQECRLAALEERVISRQIERLTKAGGPRGIGSQAMEPAGDRRTNNASAGQMQQMEGLIEKLNEKRNENLTIMNRAETVIERFRNRRDRVVIRYYYVEGTSEYEIAREMEMSRQWVNQRRNLLMETLAEKKKNKIDSQILLN